MSRHRNNLSIQLNEELFNSSVDRVQCVVGETVPESTLRTVALQQNLNVEKALDAVLHANGSPATSVQPAIHENWQCRDRREIEISEDSDFCESDQELTESFSSELVTESCTSDSGLKDIQCLDVYSSDDIWEENLLGGKPFSSVKTHSSSDCKFQFLATTSSFHQAYNISDFTNMTNSGEGHYKNAQTVHNLPSSLQLTSHLSCNVCQEDTTPSVSSMKNVLPLSLSSTKTTFQSEDINLPVKDFNYQASTRSLLVTNQHPKTEQSTESALVLPVSQHLESKGSTESALVLPVSQHLESEECTKSALVVPVSQHLESEECTRSALVVPVSQHLESEECTRSALVVPVSQHLESEGSTKSALVLPFSQHLESEGSTESALVVPFSQHLESEGCTGSALVLPVSQHLESEGSTESALVVPVSQHLESEGSTESTLVLPVSQHLESEGCTGSALVVPVSQHLESEGSTESTLVLPVSQHLESEGCTGSALVHSSNQNLETEGNTGCVLDTLASQNLETEGNTGCVLDQLTNQTFKTEESTGCFLDQLANQHLDTEGSTGCFLDQLANQHLDTEGNTGCFLDQLANQHFDTEESTGCFLDQLTNQNFKTEESTGCFLDQLANQHLDTEGSTGCFLDQLANQHLDTEESTGCFLDQLASQHLDTEESTECFLDQLASQHLDTEGNTGCFLDQLANQHLDTEESTGCFLDQLANQHLDTEESTGCFLDQLANQHLDTEESTGCFLDQLANQHLDTEGSTGCFLDQFANQHLDTEGSTGCFLDQLANQHLDTEGSTGCFIDQLASHHLDTEGSTGCFLDQLASQHLDTEGSTTCSLKQLSDQQSKIEGTLFVQCSGQNFLSGERLPNQDIWYEQDNFMRELKYPENDVQENVKCNILSSSDNASTVVICGSNECRVCALCKTKDWATFHEKQSHCDTNADFLLLFKDCEHDNVNQLTPVSQCSSVVGSASTHPSMLQLNTCSVSAGKNTNMLSKVLDLDTFFEKPPKQLLPEFGRLSVYQSDECVASSKSFSEDDDKILTDEDSIDLALALKKDRKISLPQKFERQRNEEDSTKSIKEIIGPPSGLNSEEYNYQSYLCLDSLLCSHLEVTLRSPTLKADPSMFARTICFGKGFSQFTKPYSRQKLLKEVANYRRAILNSGCHYRENLVSEKPKVFEDVGNTVSRLKFEPSKEAVVIGYETKELRSDIEENNISRVRIKQANTNASPKDGNLQFKQFTSSEPDNHDSCSTQTSVAIVEGVTSKLNVKSKEPGRNWSAKHVKEGGQIKPIINLVVIGPAGAGKSTLVEHLLSRNHGKTMETGQSQVRTPAVDVAHENFETPAMGVAQLKFKTPTMDVAQAESETPAYGYCPSKV
ncbi:uncharacterized protein LOC106469860 isoform X2 [Limulus polyphemus]|uniref:Uncharacterized protein LOC106469860 isoform X2 n=1 Tax=Limulus polyphemus TaxID=6850 RepID=A0ABM1TE29_LIMPO|nr:uncharacterized protein LOC106469860 isoform X2 [Limulus polyphemus]